MVKTHPFRASGGIFRLRTSCDWEVYCLWVVTKMIHRRNPKLHAFHGALRLTHGLFVDNL